MPIATLPVLNGSLTFVWSPHLIQSIIAQPKAFGFADFTLMSSKHMFQETPAYLAALEGTNGGPDHSDWMENSMGAIRDSMRGAELRRMNKVALEHIEGRLDALGGQSQIPDLFHWCRDVITRATAATLFGEKDCFTAKPELVDVLWLVFANNPNTRP